MILQDFKSQYLDGQLSAITRLENPTLKDFEYHIYTTHTPLIFSGKTNSWKAIKWTFESLKKDYGQSQVAPLVNLPSTDIPYFWGNKDYSQRMTLSGFIDYILDNPEVKSYLPQVNAKKFPGMDKDYNFNDFVPYKGDKPASTSVWIGTRGTHSGFHFDRRDNFLAQVIGRKFITLASPNEIENLYPLRDMFEKSAIDPAQPDFMTFPKLRNAHLLVGVVNPGDILYIPQLWWHYLHSMDASISVNHWYGEEASLVRLLQMMSKGGIGHWCTALKDGFLYGLCKRPYPIRPRSDMPTGLLLYNFIMSGVKRRLF